MRLVPLVHTLIYGRGQHLLDINIIVTPGYFVNSLNY